MRKNNIYLTASILAIVLASSLFAPISTKAQAQSTPPCHTFTQNLGIDTALSAPDAQALTADLTDAGVWNVNTPITSFNDSVASAVTGFQEKYASQILTPNDLSYGTGFVGVSTRAELNSLYGCQSNSTAASTDVASTTPATLTTASLQCPAGYVCTHINQNPVFVCPTGYTCTPAITNPIDTINVPCPLNKTTCVSPIPVQSTSTPQSTSTLQMTPSSLSLNENYIPGPESLYVGQTGTWTANAIDTTSDYGTLLYSVDWGDQNVTALQNSNSFTHSYANSGLHTITFMVQDGSGLTAQSTYNVMVFSTITNSQTASSTAICPTGTSTATVAPSWCPQN